MENKSTSQFDRINEDGILCSIISSLPVKEAVRTSVLSPRWRHIWTHVPNLIFDLTIFDAHTIALYRDFETIYWNQEIKPSVKEIKAKRKEGTALLREMADKFIRSVNSVLQHHQGLGVETLSIEFYLHKIHSHQLDAWVRFAVASKTRELSLNLKPPSFHSEPPDERRYGFPCQFLWGSSIECLHLRCCYLKLPRRFGGLGCLKKIDLIGVIVTGEKLNHFLLPHCSTLEWLSVRHCPDLLALNISHPLSRLKYLCLAYNMQLTELEIADAANLTKLEYIGPLVDFIFRGSPQLTEASIDILCEERDGDGDFDLTKLSKSLPWLESLTYQQESISKVPDPQTHFNIFIHLRHLEWDFLDSSDHYETNIRCLASLLKVAPFLEKFKSTLPNMQKAPPLPVLKEEEKPSQESLGSLPKCPHTHLKTVEIGGFSGFWTQIEFAVYLLNNAIALEMMIIAPRNIEQLYPMEINNTLKHPKHQVPMIITPRILEQRMETLNGAIKHLKHQIPANARLVVL